MRILAYPYPHQYPSCLIFFSTTHVWGRFSFHLCFSIPSSVQFSSYTHAHRAIFWNVGETNGVVRHNGGRSKALQLRSCAQRRTPQRRLLDMWRTRAHGCNSRWTYCRCGARACSTHWYAASYISKNNKQISSFSTYKYRLT